MPEQPEEPDSDQALPVTQEIFEAWLEQAGLQRDSGDHGFAIAARLAALIEENHTDSAPNHWSAIRSMVSDALLTPWYRKATTLQLKHIAVVMHIHGALDLGALSIDDVHEAGSLLSEMPSEEHSL